MSVQVYEMNVLSTRAAIHHAPATQQSFVVYLHYIIYGVVKT